MAPCWDTWPTNPGQRRTPAARRQHRRSLRRCQNVIVEMLGIRGAKAPAPKEKSTVSIADMLRVRQLLLVPRLQGGVQADAPVLRVPPSPTLPGSCPVRRRIREPLLAEQLATTCTPEIALCLRSTATCCDSTSQETHSEEPSAVLSAKVEDSPYESAEANFETHEDVVRWLAPACCNGKVKLRVAFAMLCKRLPDEDPGDIEDCLIEWMGDPSEGTMPKHVDAAIALDKIAQFFDLD